MSRSALSSPARKRARLSSPTYDASFSDLGSDDFQALDDIEAKHSQEAHKPVLSFNSQPTTSTRVDGPQVVDHIEDHNDSGIMLVDGEDVRPVIPKPASPKAGFESPHYSLSTDEPDTTAFGVFMSAASTPDAGPSTRILDPLSLEEQSGNNLHDWAIPKVPSVVGFAAASALNPKPKASGTAPTVAFGRASGKPWAPSATALEAAKMKLQVWETEIESELSRLDQDVDPSKDTWPDSTRIPLKVVENSVDPPSLVTLSRASQASTDNALRPNLPIPFRAPANTPSLRKGTANPPNTPQVLRSNPILARSSAAVGFTKQGSPLKTPLFSSPSTPVRPSSSIHPRVNSPNRASQSKLATPGPTPSQSSAQKARPLGLTPRAHAFTGSRTRPRFVTPFKQGGFPKEQGKDAPLRAPQPTPLQPQHIDKGKSRAIVHAPVTPEDRNPNKLASNSTPSDRTSLRNCGFTPQSFTNDELSQMGFDVALFGLTSVSHFLYYRFNPTGSDVSANGPLPTQTSLGADTALSTLLTNGCHLATKEWVDNHWSLILWKMIGMSCLDPTALERTWAWDEVMRQLHRRYTRELMNGARPALRRITTQDAPASTPLVLCVSDVFWTNEYVDSEGRLVPAHPELELTDGWYRLRATVDEALARATRNRILRVGRKIACSGARLESAKKDPMEVMDAYGSMNLLLSGNSTHLAQWHAKLGFQPTPFVATLGSLSSDGGSISIMDLLVTQVYPVGYIEYITTESGEQIREGPRTERDEAREDDKWKERRAHQALKLQEELEKKVYRLESYADKLEHMAGSSFQPTDDESPPDSIEDLVDELEDSEDPISFIKRANPKEAGWFSRALRKKCEIDRDKGGEEIDRELSTSFPPRQVRNFRVLRVQDAQTIRKASMRVAQLTVWDVMSLNMTEGGSAGSFAAGQRYMVTSLIPSQPSAWMGIEPGSEVFLSTRRDSKWKMIS